MRPLSAAVGYLMLLCCQALGAETSVAVTTERFLPRRDHATLHENDPSVEYQSERPGRLLLWREFSVRLFPDAAVGAIGAPVTVPENLGAAEGHWRQRFNPYAPTTALVWENEGRAEAAGFAGYDTENGFVLMLEVGRPFWVETTGMGFYLLMPRPGTKAFVGALAFADSVIGRLCGRRLSVPNDFLARYQAQGAAYDAAMAAGSNAHQLRFWMETAISKNHHNVRGVFCGAMEVHYGLDDVTTGENLVTDRWDCPLPGDNFRTIWESGVAAWQRRKNLPVFLAASIACREALLAGKPFPTPLPADGKLPVWRTQVVARDGECLLDVAARAYHWRGIYHNGGPATWVADPRPGDDSPGEERYVDDRQFGTDAVLDVLLKANPWVPARNNNAEGHDGPVGGVLAVGSVVAIPPLPKF